MQNARRDWLALFGFFLASFAAAAAGSIATAASVQEWYPLLNKPAWNPPAWLFGPVWTLLYALMSIAAWRIWCRERQPGARLALAVFFVQLGLNALWSVLFFGLRAPGPALVEIIALWGCLAWLQRSFWRIDRAAGWLWLPYLLWVSFATVLNASLWWLNR
jgi:benzodiazapine receptor